MIGETWALTARSLRKWLRTPAAVIPALIQPVFWLGLFGSAFNPTNLVPSQVGGNPLPPQVLQTIKNSILSTTFGGVPNYITYLADGILCSLLLFKSAFSGMSLVFDRRFGFLNRLLVAPIPRSSIYLSNVTQSTVKGMVQAFIIFFIALLIPGGLVLASGFGISNFLGIFVALTLLAVGFASLFTAIAIRVAKWETLIAVINFINLPLLFTSNALLPLNSFPDWLKSIAEVNPISKAAEVGRLLIVNGTLTGNQLTTFYYDMTYLVAFAGILTLIGIITAKYALKAE
jgi:ABC-2 type transport system permease protein